MKPSLKRLQEQYGFKRTSPAMACYEQVLKQVVDANGDGKSYRDDPRPLTARLNPNEVYAVRCNDNNDYWKSVMLKRNELSGKFQIFISNPVYGDPSPGMEEVSSEQMFKQMRDMNAGLVVDADLQAFPYPGRSEQ